MNVFFVAEKLGKFAWEVEYMMTPDELSSWIEFFNKQAKQKNKK